MEKHAPATFNLMDPRFLEDPFPFYRRLLEQNGVHATGPGSWFLCRHADVAAILTDDQRAVKLPERALQPYGAGAFHDYNEATLLFKDPPDYQRVRNTVSGDFSPRAVAELTATVGNIVESVLQDLEGKTEFNFITDYATRIPHRVIAHMLGISPDEEARFHEWSRILSSALEPIASLELRRQADQAVNELNAYIRDLIRQRAAGPPKRDLIGCIVGQMQSGRLSEAEAVANIPFFYVSGSETTPDLLGNGLHLLLTSPEAMAELRTQPELLDNAIEEILRLYPPAHMIHRFAVADIPLRCGVVLEKGSSITLGLAAANRDPAQFTNPDALDIHRAAKSNRHVTFGAGTRHCMGSFLSRLEGRLAMSEFLKRYPRVRLLAPPRKRPGLIFKGFSELWVAAQ
jgi:cytochrome P450